MIKRIAITGPESTGKTTLAKQLAMRFETVYVPEFARSYLDSLNRHYGYEDLLFIAKKQYKLEQKLAADAHVFLFCDTDFIVLKIWSLVKFGRCDPWIGRKVMQHHYDLYLLTDIDLPWEMDPQREDPYRRKELFTYYIAELDNLNTDYHIISGWQDDRLTNAIKCITEKYNIT